MARLWMHPVGHAPSEFLGAEDIARNRARMVALEQELEQKLQTVREGWGPSYVERVHKKGKLTTWERIRALIDEGTEVFELNTLVNWGRTFAGSKRLAPGAGVVTCLAQVQGRWTIVIANDNTVASGAWWPLSPEKIERAQTVALRLRLPVIYLVDCSGLFLPEQSRSFSGRTGAGHIFTMNARLADAGVPQVAGVFGDCIAGGGYMPIISDRVVMTEGAYMVIAGAALIRGAKALKLTSIDIGGPEVHVHQSSVADVRVPDDPTAIRLIREEIARLPSSGVDFYRGDTDPAPPRHDPAELAALFPVDFRQTYPIEEVVARLVDDSLVHEVLPHVGREMYTAVARISGLWVGIIANRQGLVEEPGQGRRPGGALYREGIAKISTFARTCSDDGIPLVWLQDISGFDIGVEAERQGLLGYGSNLIYANATPRVPVFTILLRKASGAGYYAMHGMPYEPVVQLSTPITRLAVMEGRTLAIATYNSKLDDDFEIASTDPAERALIEEGMAQTAARIEADMDPVQAAARMDTDEVVPVGRLRAWLECLVEAAWQGTGYRRTKNPRIWSLHDLEVLHAFPAVPAEVRSATLDDDTLRSPAVGRWEPLVDLGAPLQPGRVLGRLRRAGTVSELVAPGGVGGVVVEVAPAGPVEFGTALLRSGEGELGLVVAPRAASAEADAPEGVAVVRADTDGTYYRRPSPSEPPFVVEGQEVSAHDTIGLVEVMKTFNPVRAPLDGRVEKLLVQDGQGVEAGQPLVWIRPA